MSDPVPIHPVAPRLTNGLKTPHIGPDFEAYKQAHAQTVGQESDQWWSTVAKEFIHCTFVSLNCSLHLQHVKGTVLSLP